MTQVLELRAGALRLALRPDLGGCIAGLWHGDTPVLYSFDPATLTGSRPSANFPLVPYSNRIADRRFRWQGREYGLAANVDEPHTLHGVGWQRPWEVVSAEAAQAELRYVHRPDEHWPFAFEARQVLVLTPQALQMRMALRNTDTQEQPLGFGWHPYFMKRPGTRLQAHCTTRWEPDPTLLPVRPVPQPGIDDEVANLDFDNVFEGWDRVAVLSDSAFTLRITSDQPYLVVYARPSKDHCCVEPVSHLNNAIHLPDPAEKGLRGVAPGQGIEGYMNLEITRP